MVMEMGLLLSRKWCVFVEKYDPIQQMICITGTNLDSFVMSYFSDGYVNFSWNK